MSRRLRSRTAGWAVVVTVAVLAAATAVAPVANAETPPTLTSVSIAADGSNPSSVSAGGGVSWMMVASEPLQSPPTVTADGITCPQGGDISPSGSSTPTYAVDCPVTTAWSAGRVTFSITFASPSGLAGTPVTATTDGSSVTVTASSGGTPTGANSSSVPLTVQSGPLQLSWVSVSSTSRVQLNGIDQSSTGTLSLGVEDATGSGAGWHVAATSTPFTLPNGNSLPNAATVFTSKPSVQCASGATCTQATDTDNLSSGFSYVLPAGSSVPTATPLVNAASGTGLGQQTLSAPFSVSVPANSYAGTYSATWYVSLTSGP